jgi:hypothetical protein
MALVGKKSLLMGSVLTVTEFDPYRSPLEHRRDMVMPLLSHDPVGAVGKHP